MSVPSFIRAVVAVPVASLLLVSCLGDPLSSAPGDVSSGEVVVRICTPSLPGSKATALAGCEGVSSGALLLVYRAEGGAYVESCLLEGDALAAGEVEVPLRLDRTVEYDFFLLGNLGFVNTQSGELRDIYSVLGPVFPSDGRALVDYAYRLDGQRLGSSPWRRESHRDIAAFGIPYRGELRGVRPADLPDGVRLECRYLFSKVVLTVDHTGLDGGDALAAEWFRNVSLCVRQANVSMYPFRAEAGRALSRSDVVGLPGEEAGACVDYDVSMQQGTVTSFTLFIPENDQGVLLPDNELPSMKSPEGLTAAGRGSYGELCTYVEFRGSVSRAAGGYGGEILYRFYLGADARTDFSLVGGRVYRVSLGFVAGSVYGAPQWKVSPSLTDFRTLHLRTGDGVEIAAGGTLPLTVGRPLDLYPSVDDGLGAYLGGVELVAGRAWTPSSLASCGVGCAFLGGDDAGGRALSECGIAAELHAGGGFVRLTVTDGARLLAAAGRSVPLRFTLLPGAASAAAVEYTLSVPDASRLSAGGFVFTAPEVFVENELLLVYSPQASVSSSSRSAVPDGGRRYVAAVDGVSVCSFDAVSSGGQVSLGVFPRGAHCVEVLPEGGEPAEGKALYGEVCALPELSVDFGYSWTELYCYRRVCDRQGNPYVAHRRGDGSRWVDLQAAGRYDSVSYSFRGSCARVASRSGSRFVMDALSMGCGELVASFRLGSSAGEVAVPYYVYDEVYFRPAEKHGLLVLLFNDVSVGWSTAASGDGVRHTAESVVWSLELTLSCADGSHVTGGWGPFIERDAVCGDGAAHLRDFGAEFKALRQSFESGHRLEDADYLTGLMKIQARFASPYVLGNSSGTSFADFAGVVDCSVRTLSAAAQLDHFSQEGEKFYKVVR